MSNMNDPNCADLRRKMAAAGPGYRGERAELSAEERQALCYQIREAGDAVPSYLMTQTEWIDRPAKLFEAGDFPDKGISIAVQDLQEIARGFDLPVPLLIEHSDSPLELGYLTDVRCVGAELFGTIALTQEADAIVRTSKGRSLSLGLSPDLRSIQEVSLVRHPRVPSAQLFTATGHICLQGMFTCDFARERELEDRRFQADQDKRDAEHRVRTFVSQGRLCPAQAELARAMMSSDTVVDFGEDKRPVRELLIAMIERQPPMALFGETVPITTEPANHLFLPEEAAFYARHFPGIGLDDIARGR